MLTDILQILAVQQTLSLSELANKARLSRRETEIALAQLEHLGFLRREGARQGCGSGCANGCGSDYAEQHCQGCSVNAAGLLYYWALTAKGQFFAGINRNN